MRYYFILILLLTPLTALSGDPHHTHPYIPIEPEVVPQVATASSSVDIRGSSIGIAAGQCNYRFSSNKLKKCASIAQFDEVNSAWVGVAKPVCINGCKDNVWSLGVGVEEGVSGDKEKWGFTTSITW